MQSPPLRFEALFSGCQDPHKKTKSEYRGADNLTGCVARNRVYARLNSEVAGDRALRELPLAGPRAVSERSSRGKGSIEGKTENSEYEKRTYPRFGYVRSDSKRRFRVAPQKKD